MGRYLHWIQSRRLTKLETAATAFGFVGLFALSLTFELISSAPPFGSTGVQPAPRSTPTTRPAPYGAIGNLLLNSSLEVDGNRDGVADSWARIGTVGRFEIDSQARYGSGAQRIDLPAVEGPAVIYAAIQQRVTIEGSRIYLVSIDYRLVPAGTSRAGGAGVVVYSVDGAGRFVASAADLTWPAGASWTRVALRVEPPAGTTELRVEFRLSANGTLWLDGARLEALP